MKWFELSAEELRNIIIGKTLYRKCPLCDNDGDEIQAYDDEGEPCASDHPEAMRDTCQNCDGVAFIKSNLSE